MILFWMLVVAAAVVSFLMGKLPHFIGFIIVSLILLKIAAGLVFIIATFFSQGHRYCCHRC